MFDFKMKTLKFRLIHRRNISTKKPRPWAYLLLQNMIYFLELYGGYNLQYCSNMKMVNQFVLKSPRNIWNATYISINTDRYIWFQTDRRTLKRRRITYQKEVFVESSNFWPILESKISKTIAWVIPLFLKFQ